MQCKHLGQVAHHVAEYMCTQSKHELWPAQCKVFTFSYLHFYFIFNIYFFSPVFLLTSAFIYFYCDICFYIFQNFWFNSCFHIYISWLPTTKVWKKKITKMLINSKYKFPYRELFSSFASCCFSLLLFLFFFIFIFTPDVEMIAFVNSGYK